MAHFKMNGKNKLAVSEKRETLKKQRELKKQESSKK